MSDPVISVENLSKSYLIGHQGPRERYTSLRDTLANGAKSVLRKTRDLASGRQSLQGDSIEEFWALKDVSFEVKQGEVLGIIGRNGAGKSTLLKVLSRITEPTSGRVTLTGRVASLLEVGTGFHPELTGRENLFLNGAILGMTRREISSKFDEIVDFAGVEKFLDTPVKRYSSGMYVRLAFAVAAHLEPEILVVDEVLAVGDAEFQKKCIGKMQEVAKGGRTVLFVSHDLNAITRLCSAGVLLNEGRVISVDKIKNVIASYRSTSESTEDSWTLNECSTSKAIQFTEAHLSKAERSGLIELIIKLKLSSLRPHKNCFIAADILDPVGNCIMQVIPTHDGFISPSNQEHQLSISASLPPLIPGKYSLTLWVGPHNTETYDLIERKISFTILESPCPGRLYPHTGDHGYIVAPSKIQELMHLK
ncbi:MAG: ATP-binding cassette domain-containing protein [Akkermansiaceae bacterium]|nr:ATP-binding cassette domain-containing protein [Akkermansiaceae bacterium]